MRIVVTFSTVYHGIIVNLVEDTLFRRKKKLNPYFEYLHSIGITRPEDITVEPIHNYLTTLTGLSQKTGAGLVLFLRQFFDAMYLAGIINVKLSEHVPTMKLVYQDKFSLMFAIDNTLSFGVSKTFRPSFLRLHAFLCASQKQQAQIFKKVKKKA